MLRPQAARLLAHFDALEDDSDGELAAPDAPRSDDDDASEDEDMET